MLFTRRAFIVGTAALPLVASTALAVPRAPYVTDGLVVDFIGLGLHPAPTFIGGRIVRKVGAWNGEFYPCALMTQSYRDEPDDIFPDTDLSQLRTECPADFWHDRANRDRYPNLVAYVREQRYGEDPATYYQRRYRDMPDLIPLLHRKDQVLIEVGVG